MTQPTTKEENGYIFNDSEFNLASEFKRTVQRAFKLYPDTNLADIAVKLGISTRTLYRMVKDWDIEVPRKTKRKNRNLMLLGAQYY